MDILQGKCKNGIYCKYNHNIIGKYIRKLEESMNLPIRTQTQKKEESGREKRATEETNTDDRGGRASNALQNKVDMTGIIVRPQLNKRKNSINRELSEHINKEKYDQRTNEEVGYANDDENDHCYFDGRESKMYVRKRGIVGYARRGPNIPATKTTEYTKNKIRSVEHSGSGNKRYYYHNIEQNENQEEKEIAGARSDKACKYLLRGKCRVGKLCRYNHNIMKEYSNKNLKNNDEQKVNKPCWYQKTGICKKGQQCNYNHEICQHNQMSRCKFGEKCHYIHIESATTSYHRQSINRNDANTNNHHTEENTNKNMNDNRIQQNNGNVKFCNMSLNDQYLQQVEMDRMIQKINYLDEKYNGKQGQQNACSKEL